ncbi:hypothetical protein JD844_009727 [Phrynosoma platyrhinos]|uniref:tRNA uridine(34) hydroxylase N-terminal domain-containing protein n=1 Tax=Phrynosoma platyrhinos TaxID=52577 RepID=A0ABQ7TFG4_PHRPL|nr:hypothetical protein JD844_009727 [Phrynosoma platyrhinos]
METTKKKKRERARMEKEEERHREKLMPGCCDIVMTSSLSLSNREDAGELCTLTFVDLELKEHTPFPPKGHLKAELDASTRKKHVAVHHSGDVGKQTLGILKQMAGSSNVTCSPVSVDEMPRLNRLPYHNQMFQKLPNTSHIDANDMISEVGQVLLYYCYCEVADPGGLCAWQKALCQHLHLTGKVRIASEGINGTVGGSKVATNLYMDAMLSHPLFKGILVREDFKTSKGGAHCFPDLRIGVFEEIVPMGINPEKVSYKETGIHLTPKEFHAEVEKYLSRGNEGQADTILLDCRNFYESKIVSGFQLALLGYGNMTDADFLLIQEHTYLALVVVEVRRARLIERLAFIHLVCVMQIAKSEGRQENTGDEEAGICKGVYHLKGGIHKYLEEFPDGFYRGKLFVFDERYTIPSNGDVISGG